MVKLFKDLSSWKDYLQSGLLIIVKSGNLVFDHIVDVHLTEILVLLPVLQSNLFCHSRMNFFVFEFFQIKKESAALVQ